MPTTLPCVSMWQPWASAVAVGSKKIETRSWATKYRGPLAIHAAARCRIYELIHLRCHSNWHGALFPLDDHQSGKTWDEVLPFGAVIAVCNLVDIRPTDSFTLGELMPRRYANEQHERHEMYGWNEHGLGNFELGRFGWVLENVKALPEPIPWKGRQSLFNVTLPWEPYDYGF